VRASSRSGNGEGRNFAWRDERAATPEPPAPDLLVVLALVPVPRAAVLVDHAMHGSRRQHLQGLQEFDDAILTRPSREAAAAVRRTPGRRESRALMLHAMDVNGDAVLDLSDSQLHQDDFLM
jgi:hypothetical protein